MKENEYINEDDSVCPRDWREIEKEQELKEIFEANFLDGNKMETDACTFSIRGAFDVAEFFYQKGREEAYELIGQQYQVSKRLENNLRLETLKEVENILQKELETWKKESVGWKAVESIILAIKEYKQYKLNEEIEEEFEKFCIKGFIKEMKKVC